MNHVLFSSASDEWATPPEVYAALDAEFGFADDACPLGGAENGLMREWRSPCFVNPPYSEIRPWMEKASLVARVRHDGLGDPIPARPTQVRRSEGRRTIPERGGCVQERRCLLTLTPDTARVGQRVRLRGHRPGYGPHAMRGTILAVERDWAVVRPDGHQRGERVEWRFVHDWKAANAGVKA